MICIERHIYLSLKKMNAKANSNSPKEDEDELFRALRKREEKVIWLEQERNQGGG